MTDDAFYARAPETIASGRGITLDEATSVVALADAATAVARSRNPALAGLDGVALNDVHLGDVVRELSDQVRSGRYRPGALRVAKICIGRDARRDVCIDNLRDQICGRAVGTCLGRKLDGIMSPLSFGFRSGLSTSDAGLVIADSVLRTSSASCFFVKADIDDCFESMSHILLKRKVYEYVRDRRLARLVVSLVDRCRLSDAGPERPKIGFPPGLSISPVLLNICLTPLDVVLESRARYGVSWVRYADDLLAVVPGGRDAAEAELRFLAQELQRIRLKLAAEKTVVAKVEDGIDFVGFRFQRQGYPLSAECEVSTSAKSIEKLRTSMRDVVAEALDEGYSRDVFIRAVSDVLRGWMSAFRIASDVETVAKGCGTESLRDWVAGDLRVPIDEVEKRAQVLGRSLWGRSGSS